MKEKIKIFFSYQWVTDDRLRSAVVADLQQLDNVEVIVDKDAVSPADKIHEIISEKIDDCDCVLVSFDSLESKEVLSELIRADERGKKIYLLQKNDDNSEIPKHLYFLSDRLKIKYVNIDDLNQKLKTFFKQKKKSDFEAIFRNLRAIQKNLSNLSELPNFKADLIKRIIDEADKEIEQVQQKEYKINVGIEKNFLIRARSIFENAKEVYAVSIDNISTFWLDEKNKTLAKNYINNQPNNTVRLFVFSSLRTANQYKGILQANHNSYGEDGRVLICSLNSYSNLIEQFISADLEKYLSQDFAILVYGQQYFVEALLDHSELKFRDIDLSSPSQVDHHSMVNYFKELKKLGFNQVSKDENKHIYIKRWNPNCIFNHQLWKNELEQLFPGERTGDVYHLVLFKDNDGNLATKILEAKIALSNIKDDMKLKIIWFGRKTENNPVTDFEYGQLKRRFDYDYILIMSFGSYEDLRRYYATEKHSEIRKNLYKSIHKGVGFLYKYLDEIKERNQTRALEIFEATIEEIVGKYMVRYDFFATEDIDAIVKEKFYSFPFEIT